MRLILISSLFSILCFWAFARKQNSQQIHNQSSGEDLYKTYCKSCHGRTGKGLFKLYPPLNDKSFLNNDSLMVAIITQGLKGPITVSGKEYNQEMPGIKEISDQEIAAVVNYVRQEFVQSAQILKTEKVQALRKAIGS